MNEARAYVIARLAQAPTLDALRRVWDSLSPAYQRDPEIQYFKDYMKGMLK